MAELTQREAQELCDALTLPISVELGKQVRMQDVSHDGWRWDLEVRSPDNDELLRKVSCVRLVHELSVKAHAELRDDFKPALEAGFAVRDLRGYWMSFNSHVLPTTKRARRAYGDLVAEHVTRWLTCSDAGRRLQHVHCLDVRALSWDLDGSDALWFVRGFNGFNVIRAPDDRPAQVVGWSDGRFTRFVPPLEHAALAIIESKLGRHGMVAKELTLLVQLDDAIYSLTEAARVRMALRERPTSSLSVYIMGREPRTQALAVERVQ